MKTRNGIVKGIAAMVFVAITVIFLAGRPGINDLPGKANGNGIAVVELFTSEGCSSCPPADELIARLQEQDTARRLFILSYHVDYWDHQGWKDRFSSHAWSQRQQQYAQWLHLRSVYTPQLIVNGASEHIGSDERSVSAALQQAFSNVLPGRLALDVAAEGRQVKVSSTLRPGPHEEIWVALVQREAQSRVAAGENTGRKLAHVQIVRDMQPLRGKGVHFQLPARYEREQWEIIAFVQDMETGHITDAARGSWK